MTGVTTIRQNVNAVAGPGRNIIVNAAGGAQGLNGTRPRRVTSRTLKVREYKHFDDPLDRAALDALVLTSDQVAQHAFFPLLAYTKTRRKIDFSVFPPVVDEKPREIKYAAHMDSAIYATYASVLADKYEAVLAQRQLGSSVLAYRGGIGYNVPFAKSLFDEIRTRGECSVICLDISKFFDCLNHTNLRSRLMGVLGCDHFPDDWLSIFRRLTRFEYVEAKDIEARLGKPKGRRICSIDVFREVIRKLIRRNQKDHGIPQGTPLSGLLANIYMLDFDATVKAWVEARGGSYRRYSDDIAVVLPRGDLEAEFLTLIRAEASAIHLSLNDKKTCRTQFATQGSTLVSAGDQLQYLGFIFDGANIRIRSESMKAFYARMKTNLRRYVRAAKRDGIPADEIRKRVVIGRFTHWGDSRNFVQYAYRAARELDSPAIRRQLRNHVGIFDRYWAQMIAKFYSEAGNVAD
ncbi:MAG: hypothetical protein EON91_07200 [Brevundimonas sp.]|uniref:antiviral reverse transcriptase Drt2 n=1 Tax=Brevundimonas sp. TaxID=1871086 RepID=UPI0011F75791|nr:antiviral reverse transcriptase Drt2 [Brevundimonas sp.]RZJ18016.1 MAG: hypothetical protein EON91_07200 [Brevundimonas sp.]